MKAYQKNLILYILLVLNLSGCVVDNEMGYSYPVDYEGTVYSNPVLYTDRLYDDYSNLPQDTADNQDFRPTPYQGQDVDVPETYHVSSVKGPVSARSRDKNWVSSQNPGNYTIELGNSSQAVTVAKTLMAAPKQQRTAEVKYDHNGRVYYRGIYGSYKTQTEAQKALDSLPNNVRNNARVIKFSHVK